MRWLGLAIALAGLHHASAAAAFVDDFDDDEMDESLWSVIGPDSGVTVQEINQRVEVDFAADASGTTFFGGYECVPIFGGDLDVSISYDLLEWPVKNGVRVGLALISPTVPQSFWTMERLSGGAIEQFGDVYVSDYNTSLGLLVSTSDPSGRLRIARVGDTISAWYWADGDWQLLRSEAVSTGDLRFEFAAWSHDVYFADQRVHVAFDDVEAVPEPSLAVLVGTGVAAIGARARRFRRP